MLPTIASRVYHITTFVWYLVLIYLLLNTQYSHPLPGVFLYAGQWKYLTFLNLFVVTSFWLLFTYDRALVYPEDLDAFIPLWLNHAVHTVVLPLILLELFNTPHQYPKRRTGLLILGLVSISYLLWVLWIYYAAGAWVYPLLGQFNRLGLVLFFSVSLLLVMLLYLLGEKLTSLIWGLADKTKKHK
ncbi:androgen-dependent TFPI-regulating protein-like isoform X3 [Chiloscyllium punctatum]|uniref:androgen-dependent TFPI-regulating protein-like isoform X3 n=1 Tax=Chiloscyllium punctatum TaxID=137246 RepID=UPI003B63DBEC